MNSPSVRPRRGLAFALAVSVAALLAACKDTRVAAREKGPAAVSVSLRWARGVTWETREAKSGARTEVRVLRPWKGAHEPLRYEITRPARRIACLAAPQVGFLAALGASGAIIAVDAVSHVYDSTVRAGVAAGRVFEAGSGSQLNVERLIAAKPDLVLANAVGAADYDAFKRLRGAGIPVLITGEWMEDHPLARAEWIRLFGVLLGRERQADSLFAVIEKSYLDQAALARARAAKPTVLVGAPFRDQWFVPGGRSYMARFLEDAGAEYLWKTDTTAGGVPLSFETVLKKARAADVWLYPEDWSHPWKTLADGLRQDKRFGAFSAFSRGNVYNNDARRLPDGANDYWESGLVNPQRMLADLVSIFHGSEDTLYYHRRVPPHP